MSFFRRLKKSRQPSQQPLSLGIPTQIAVGALGISADVNLDVGPGGETNARGSGIVLRDIGGVQKPRPSGGSTPIRDREDGVASAHELYEPNIPSDAPKGYLGYVTPNLSIADGEQGVQGQEEHKGLRTVTERPAEVLVEHVSKGNRVGKGAYEGTPGVAKGSLKDGPIDHMATRGFGSLKTILSDVFTNHKGNAAVMNKAEGLLSRVIALEEHFDSLPGDLAEQRRRDGVIQKLKDIEGQLRHSFENPEPQQPVNGQVSGLLEDLREAMFAYQMALQLAIYEQGCRLIDPVELSVLNNFRCARGAEYRHGGRKGCLKGTRKAVLDEIELWTSDFDKLSVYWLNGLAGTGKSTIAQTIAERVFADGRLGASFFCSRDFEDRSNLQFIFPTLAVQLARRYTEFRSAFVPLVQSDPGISYESLCSQMDKLIVQPLRESGISTVIVIDALDECKDEEPASAILSVLGQFVSELPKVKLLLTGRPEPRIQNGFRLPLLVEITDIFVLHEVKSIQVDNDIQLFFKNNFIELAQHRMELDNWPAKAQLDILCEQAAGFFVYAVAAVKFIGRQSNDPRTQLDRLLQYRQGAVCVGQTKFNTNTTLDSLYMSILQEAFGDNTEDDAMIHSVLGTIVLVINPLSPSSISTLLGFDIKDVKPLLSSVSSLLILSDDVNQPIRPFHKSFPDFMTNPTQCTSQRYYIPLHYHLELLVSCLNLMNQTLEKNMCHLPDDAVKNSEVEDLGERTEKYINHALQYACKSWHKHLVNEPTAKRDEITSALHWFLEKKFLCWLEVLSVLGAVRIAVNALQVAAKWLEESQTLDLANDCFRFVTRFIEAINTSAPHIYHSALVLCPKESIVRKLYGPQAKPLARVIQGIPASWDPSIATMRFSSEIMSAVWSSCSRFIAVAYKDSSGIVILDAATLGHLNIMHFQTYARWEYITFSPDGHLLTAYSIILGCIISWDLQTGGLISEITTGQKGECNSVSYSRCETMIGGLFADNKRIIIYNILSGICISSHSIQQPTVGIIWTYGKYLQFATVELRSITLWQVGFTSSHPPTEVGSLPTPENFSSEGLVLLPTLSRLAFILDERLVVWDAQNHKVLLDSIDLDYLIAISFSPNGQFFVCGTWGKEFHIWKESPTGYHSHQTFISDVNFPTPLVSPDGESVLSFGSSLLQLWHVTNPLTLPPSFIQPPHNGGRPLVELSPDESLMAVTRRLSSTVTVFDLNSGNPWLVIDTDTKNCGLRITGDKMIVVGNRKIITWDLPTRGSISNARRDINISSQITTFQHSVPVEGLYASISPNLSYVAFWNSGTTEKALCIYSTHTGQRLTAATSYGTIPGFTSSGHEVWCARYNGIIDQWEVIEENGSDSINLKKCDESIKPQSGFPWHPLDGYKLTDDGWICSSGKWVLWLPHHLWQDDEIQKKWGTRFLALWNRSSPEPCILQFNV